MFQVRISLCNSPDCPETHFIDQGSLKLIYCVFKDAVPVPPICMYVCVHTRARTHTYTVTFDIFKNLYAFV